MDEATALLMTLSTTPPDAPTACPEWTAHELVAHLAAGAAEMAGHVERVLSGVPERETIGFAAREAPFVGMEDEALRERLLIEALRLNAAVEELAEKNLMVAFSGRRMSAGEIQMHGRSEAALHRWDLCGDDDIGDELLHQPELTQHAVKVLNSMLAGSSESPPIRAQRAGIREPAHLAFGAPGQPDVVLTVDDEGACFDLVDTADSPLAVTDSATRLLALWGRRSADRTITWDEEDQAAQEFALFLWGQKAARPAHR